ncbi:hypothetical protein TcCL_ESM00775, partial [Trypanosoma cruzi]
MVQMIKSSTMTRCVETRRACTSRAGNSFWGSHLSPRMNTARAIGQRRGILTAENLNSQRDHAQVAGDHQHLCALFNAQLAAQEKRDSVRPSRKSSPREVKDFREKETRLLTRERLGEAS